MLRASFIGLLSLSAAASGAVAQTRASLVNDVDLDRLGFRRLWEANLPVEVGESIQNAYLVDEALYVTTDVGVLYSIEANLGLIRWVEHVTEPAFRIYKPTHIQTADGKGPTVVLTTSGLLLLDRYNGGRLAHINPGFAPGSAPLAIGGRYFAGGNDGRFYSLSIGSARDGRPTKVWEVVVGGAVTADPLLYEGDKLLFASQDGGVYSCFATDKALLWSYRTGGGIVGDPAIDGSGVYVASLDRILYKLSLLGGRPQWRVRFDDPLRRGPVAVAHTVYQYSISRGMTALDADNGKQRWVNQEADRFVAHSQGRDVLYSPDQRLLVLDHETGEQIGAIGMPHATGAVTNTKDDAVFILGTRGRVLCLRIDEVPYLRSQQIQSARTQLNQPPNTSGLDIGPFPETPGSDKGKSPSAHPLRSWRERKRE